MNSISYTAALTLIFSLPEHYCIFSTPIQVLYTPQFSSRPPGSVCGCAERILTGPCSAEERANPILTQHIPQQSAPRCTSSGRLPGTAMGMHWPGPAGQGGDRGRGVMYIRSRQKRRVTRTTEGEADWVMPPPSGNPDITYRLSVDSFTRCRRPPRQPSPPSPSPPPRTSWRESVFLCSPVFARKATFAHRFFSLRTKVYEKGDNCSDFQGIPGEFWTLAIDTSIKNKHIYI